jgi:hypothetical protein
LKKLLILSFVLFLCVIIAGKSTSSNYTINTNSDSLDKIQGEEKILFIVDFSNSMNDFIGSKRKIEIAIDSLVRITAQLNPNIQTGLRVYGHKNGFNPILGCRATELVNPIKANNIGNIRNTLFQINPQGWTPITKSLKNAVNYDFAGISGKKRIILLTDGGENCDESPCEYAIKLMQERDDIKIDIIAFTVDDEDAESQLKCTALATFGKVYTAKTEASLAKSLEQALNISTEVQGTIIKKH